LEGNLLLVAAVEHDLLHALGQFFERPLEIESVMGREALQKLIVELIAPVPTLDRAGSERQMREADHALGIEEADRDETVAARTRAHRVVEREQPRLQLLERVVADRTGEFSRIEMLRPRVHLYGDRPALAMS